jgi:hypothetical protein
MSTDTDRDTGMDINMVTDMEIHGHIKIRMSDIGYQLKVKFNIGLNIRLCTLQSDVRPPILFIMDIKSSAYPLLPP